MKGRQELLEKGYIAQVLNLKGETQFPAAKAQLYLPANPKMVWEEFKIEQPRAFDDSDVKIRDDKIGKIEKNYTDNFGDYGVGIEGNDEKTPNISIYYTGRWFFYTIISNLKSDHRLDLMMGRLGSFKNPFIGFYMHMFQNNPGLHLRIIYKSPINKSDHDRMMQERIKNINVLKGEYPGNIDFGSPLVPHATSRRVLFGLSDGKTYMAIDARKIFPMGAKDSSYIGTVYLQEDALSEFRSNFDAAWSSKLEESSL